MDAWGEVSVARDAGIAALQQIHDKGTGLLIQVDAAGSWRWAEPESGRLRQHWVDKSFSAKVQLSESDEWVRLDVFAEDMSNFPLLRPGHRTGELYLRGFPYHFTTLTTPQIKSGLSPNQLQDLQCVRKWFGTRSWRVSLLVRSVSGYTGVGRTCGVSCGGLAIQNGLSGGLLGRRPATPLPSPR